MNPLTQESLELLKGALAQPNDTLAKSISTATGLLAYDLQAPAKNLYPFVTPIRNVMPRVGGGTGSATNWRQVNAIIGSGFDAMGWVPEGQRSGQMSYSTSNKSATYVTIGEEDAATFEAISAGRQFEDIQARMTFRLLQKMMLKEEMAILAGNATLTLGTPATPTLSASGTGATLPTATYYVKVVALDPRRISEFDRPERRRHLEERHGRRRQELYAVRWLVEHQRRGEPGCHPRPDACSAASSRCRARLPMPGMSRQRPGPRPCRRSRRSTALPSQPRSAPATSRQTAITGDNSANSSYAYDGLLTTALKPGSNAYVNIMPTGTAGTGTPLTASGRGSVVEIDTMFQKMWDNFELSPTVLYVNSQELKNITSKVLSNASGPLLRYELTGRRQRKANTR